ncbi:MAG: acyl-CoA dehydrogenase family protein [Labilithrix sp.]|nr:acyl-CoA dehydrogenase family protein [Labilithrix sp.]MBX3222727.1 acyl-CoA dehydrogenase family protein [Labilithrix sp.]
MDETHGTEWVDRARRLGPALAEVTSRHDLEGTFVRESYSLLREHRFFSMGVPRELGGASALHGEICETVRELARHCGSTALAFSMHSHLVATAVWRQLHGQPADALLRKIAASELVLLSTGASDWVDSNGTMVKVDGGYRVTARKIFGSGAPAADLLMTSAPYDDPGAGPQVLHFSVPMSADGLTLANDWNTLGMRGTGSSTVEMTSVFVPEEAISLRRPRCAWHPAWSVTLTVAIPVFMAAYVGIAEAASELALAAAANRRDAPYLPQLAGELDSLLMQTHLAWRAAVDGAANYDFTPSLHRANRALVAKTLCANAATATVRKAMEIAGGPGFFRGPLERMLRDVSAAPYHVLPEKRQLHFSGLLALGRDPITGRSLTESGRVA